MGRNSHRQTKGLKTLIKEVAFSVDTKAKKKRTTQLETKVPKELFIIEKLHPHRSSSPPLLTPVGPEGTNG
jgi:hypothetical protein